MLTVVIEFITLVITLLGIFFKDIHRDSDDKGGARKYGPGRLTRTGWFIVALVISAFCLTQWKNWQAAEAARQITDLLNKNNQELSSTTAVVRRLGNQANNILDSFVLYIFFDSNLTEWSGSENSVMGASSLKPVKQDLIKQVFCISKGPVDSLDLDLPLAQLPPLAVHLNFSGIESGHCDVTATLRSVVYDLSNVLVSMPPQSLGNYKLYKNGSKGVIRLVVSQSDLESVGFCGQSKSDMANSACNRHNKLRLYDFQPSPTAQFLATARGEPNSIAKDLDGSLPGALGVSIDAATSGLDDRSDSQATWTFTRRSNPIISGNKITFLLQTPIESGPWTDSDYLGRSAGP